MAMNLKYEKLKKVFLRLTYLLRGYTNEDWKDSNCEAQRVIRYAYVKNSQPFQDIEDGVSYVWVNYANDSNNNEIFVDRTYDAKLDKFKVSKTQLRKLEVHWIFYGESAQDDAFESRMRIFSDEAKEFLGRFGISLILEVPECVLLYEKINEQWWPRVEFTVPYYITTEIEETVEKLTSANVYLETEKNEYQILV